MKLLLLVITSLLSCLTVSARVSLGFSGEEAASVGIYVKDIKTGEIVAQNDASKALVPASVMKSVTAATIFSTMDPEFRFETGIYLTDRPENGVCNGNLVIESIADPTIDSDLFKDKKPRMKNEILNALKENGVHTIKGEIVINDYLSDSGCIPQWQIDDVAWAYGAGLYGFNFNDNAFNLWPATMKMMPEDPDLIVEVRHSESTDLIRGINSNYLIAEGVRTDNPKWSVRTTMNDPATVFEHDLYEFLCQNGIMVENESIHHNERILLLTHQSPSLSEILNAMLVESHNLFAEGMLRLLAPGESRKKALEKEAKIWRDRGLDIKYNKIIDGSGLARGDRLQPVFIADVLEWMAKSSMSLNFISLFPKVGIDGTVQTLLKDTPLRGKLALKSGSMSGVQCYAGYKLDESGSPTHVVVILVNGFFCERPTLRKSIENFLLKTF